MRLARSPTKLRTCWDFAIRLAAGCVALFLAAPTQSSEAFSYAVLSVDGERAGHHNVHRDETGLTSVEFVFKENGRGPELKESFRVAADGTFSEYRVSGVSEFGAAVDETFQRAGEVARWHTPFEHTRDSRSRFTVLDSGADDSVCGHELVRHRAR